MGRKQNIRTGESSSPSLSHVYLRLRETLLIFAVVLSVFMLLSLTSYHRTDPGWSHLVSNSPHVANLAGPTGAWIADFLLNLSGVLAYLPPFVIGYALWIAYQQRQQVAEEKPPIINALLITLRAIGFVFILLSGCALADLHLSHLTLSFPYGAGGIMGRIIATAMVAAFNHAGASLLLFAGLLLGVTFFAGISWFHLLEATGEKTLALFTRIRETLSDFENTTLYLKWKQYRDHQLLPEEEGAQKPVIHQAPPMVDAPKEGKTKTLIDRLTRPRNKSKDEINVTPQHIDEEVTHAIAKPPRFSKSQIIPDLSLLDTVNLSKVQQQTNEALEARSQELEHQLTNFGIQTHVVAVHPGPVVTRYELSLAPGTKVSKISGLAKDLARSLSVVSVRVVEVIPGKSVIGIELPNTNRATVTLKEVLGTDAYTNARSPLTLALGKDIAGHPVVVDLAKMPHLLVAGTTGSGKSVSLNAMLLSLLYKSSPEQLRLILIDPKMLELSIYDGVPHLLTPVVTDMKDAAGALRWCVVEMERRYRMMAALGVRNIDGYNEKIRQADKKGKPLLDPLTPPDAEEPQYLQHLPKIVVIADEFADMMVVVGKKVETLIARLAQKARAAGVHLIFATQRPSVDVITGLIKANIPTRIAFQVSQKVDSRTILDQSGAEQLLGNGDMLYLPPGCGVPVRVHGAFVSDDEVHRVVDNLRQNAEPQYIDDLFDDASNIDPTGYTDSEENAENDPLYDQAVDFVIRTRRVSVSSVQRRFKIGYNRASRIVEGMEAAGVVSQMESNGTREVLAPAPLKGR